MRIKTSQFTRRGDRMKIQLTEEQETRLDALIEKINATGQWYDEYMTENSDNPVADYCAWGWKEWYREEPAQRLLNDSWAKDSSTLCERALEKDGMTLEKLSEILVEIAGEPQYSAGYDRNEGEIFSVQVGETEIQVSDDEWFKEFHALTDDEFAYVERRVEYSIRKERDFMYTQDDGRWCLIVDEGTLAETLFEKGLVTQAELNEIFDTESK